MGWDGLPGETVPRPQTRLPTAGEAQPDLARGGKSLQWSLSGEGGEPRVGCSGLVSVLPLGRGPRRLPEALFPCELGREGSALVGGEQNFLLSQHLGAHP